ncbi:MAG TPA: helix-turn-helix transcriptional regulator [Nocardioides bacterium]|uniref:helix-turn-helix transcriptional regulator n=1 Tax=uncultured Nocardioides sp. TaxID=198441 RepID=UPI000EEC1ABD|nr:helix-turn-helix transcriptional regulator [uncultured Nocardioides sp.]HCB07379.1 helix-turn-helix transcriptional regulator [Nocardioides sp.]
MTAALTAERVRGDVEVLSRAGLDLETFLAEAVASVSRAVPWVAACIGTHDPATRMLTSSRKFGDLTGQNSHDGLFGQIEYDSAEVTTYPELAGTDLRSIGVHLWFDGEVERSERMTRLMLPKFDYHDEARLVFREGGRFWGGMALFRGSDDHAFGEAEIEFLASLSEYFGRGVRTGLLTRLADATPPNTVAGPAVMVIDAAGELVQSTPAATARLAEMSTAAHAGAPYATITAVVGAARRLARGETDSVPHARIRTAHGVWLVLHASPLSGLGDRDGDVVVTIEEARPPEIVSLVVAAFDLTPRERDVTQLVLQGVDTKEIAATLHMSAYTVQDHLKSVFDKADVRSRRELIARVFFDQYVPRMGNEVMPSGFFGSA